MLRSALLNVMIKAARKAARTLKRDFGEVEHLQISLKGPANFVTAADRRAEEILHEELSQAPFSTISACESPVVSGLSIRSSPAGCHIMAAAISRSRTVNLPLCKRKLP